MLADTLVPADRWSPGKPILELDEIWTFVMRKTDAMWIWIALCRQSRQIVAFVVGDRSAVTCLRLWSTIPVAYRAATCYSDFWAAYAAVIPRTQQHPVGKETGATAHVER